MDSKKQDWSQRVTKQVEQANAILTAKRIREEARRFYAHLYHVEGREHDEALEGAINLVLKRTRELAR